MGLLEAVLGSFARRVNKPTSTFFPAVAPDLTMLLEPGQSGVDVTSTAADQASIAEFLATPAVRVIVSTYCLKKLLLVQDGPDPMGMSDDALHRDFLDAASRWCRLDSLNWDSYAGLVWEAATSGALRLAPRLTSGDLGVDHEALLEMLFFGGTDTGTARRYLTVALDLAMDPAAMRRLGDSVRRIAEATRVRLDGKFVVHGADRRVEFDALYVDRSLVDVREDRIVESRELLAPCMDWQHCVVIGDPGVGKSTLVSWIEWSASRDEHSGIAPTIVIPSSLWLSQKAATLVGTIRDVIEARYGESLDAVDVERLLATGAVTIIVDALDEIRDKSWRADVVGQAGVLANTYPALRVICSTRRTGNEAAELQRIGFRLLAIAEYSDAQVESYVERWFRHTAQEDRSRKFIGESRHLRDLVVNPLMLSLLCAMYLRSSYIPQSRWHVYERCAYLMFLEWETARDLEVPLVHKENGEAAIRALVHYFRSSGGYSAAIPESIARKVIADVLASGGASKFEAQADADTILRHCTERAWVFSEREGSTRERHFGFTHRTFYEYYLADSIVSEIFGDALRGRSNGQSPLQALREAIVDEHGKDPSSVLPELVVQAADGRSDGAAGEQLLAELVVGSETRYEVSKRGLEADSALSERELGRRIGELRPSRSDYARCVSRISLATRLLAGVRVGETYAGRVFDRSVALWGLADLFRPTLSELAFSVESMEAFRCLLDLPSGHREAFQARARDDVVLARLFGRRYAVIAIRDETSLYDPSWLELSKQIAMTADSEDDPVEEWFQVWRGAVLPWSIIARRAHRSHLYVEVSEGSSPRSHTKIAVEVVRAGIVWHWLASLRAPLDRPEVIRLQAYVRIIVKQYLKDAGHAEQLDEFLVLPESVNLVRESCEFIPPIFLFAVALGSQSSSAGTLMSSCGNGYFALFEALVSLRQKAIDERRVGGELGATARESMLAEAHAGYHALTGVAMPRAIAVLLDLAE